MLVLLTQSGALFFFLACTDKELRNLASRLKDWFGALHEDANRVIKPTSSETAQGSKKTPYPLNIECCRQLPGLREHSAEHSC